MTIHKVCIDQPVYALLSIFVCLVGPQWPCNAQCQEHELTRHDYSCRTIMQSHKTSQQQSVTI